MLAACAWLMPLAALRAAPVDIGSRLELFVDSYLIESLDGVRLQIGAPKRDGVVMRFDQPWEHGSSFVTVFRDGGRYRMYYRGSKAGPGTEVTCYAESSDGIAWTRPGLGLVKWGDGRDTNIILEADEYGSTHNFSPMLDDRPGVLAAERYKAIGGKGPTGKPAIGMLRFVSADGIHWKRYGAPPLFAGYALDSHNVLTWCPAENCYAIYLRTWTEGGTPSRPAFKGFRTISRATSRDFVHWTEPEPMTFGNTPAEHLYTNNTQPYLRAPHILIAMPRRYFPDRQAYPVEQQVEWGVPRAHAKGIADAVLMSSRGGNAYDRTFMQSFLRPGTDPLSWHARENPPSNGIVQTGPEEMSFYVINHFPMPSQYLTRVTLRLDGFASAHADYATGTLVTKPIRFSGSTMILNLATSAGGGGKVDILDSSGAVLASSEEIIGDSIARTVRWKGAGGPAALAGREVRIRFRLHDADLYSFRFSP